MGNSLTVNKPAGQLITRYHAVLITTLDDDQKKKIIINNRAPHDSISNAFDLLFINANWKNRTPHKT